MSRTAIAALSAAGLFALVHREVLGIKSRPSWPPPPDAVTAGRRAGRDRGVRRRTRSRDAALDFAWSTAATIEPWAEGVNFFPRIFADVEAAQTSVHILMFGWREGEVGMAMAELLQRRLADGVEVRVIVDNMGSKPRAAARDMYAALAAAGAQIVVNDFPIACATRARRPPQALRDRRRGRLDRRRGIEDHFRDGGFHDVMARVTGDVVRQAQAAFLTSFRGHGGALPADLSHLFPAPADPGTTPVVLAQVIPGGFVAAPEAIREQIDGARERLDVMNPYLTDPGMIERILAAARRGVRVRVVVSEKSNNGLATAALQHRYADLLAAGVEVWELPGTVVHAKVVVADDVVSFGTVNLDAWALYRNSELMLLARSAEVAEQFRERLFEPDIARCQAGRPPTGRAEAAEPPGGQAHVLPIGRLRARSPAPRAGGPGAGCGRAARGPRSAAGRGGRSGRRHRRRRRARAERVQLVGVGVRPPRARARRRSRTASRSRPRARRRATSSHVRCSECSPAIPSTSLPPAYSISCGVQWPATNTGSSHSSAATRTGSAARTASRTRSIRLAASCTRSTPASLRSVACASVRTSPSTSPSVCGSSESTSGVESSRSAIARTSS